MGSGIEPIQMQMSSGHLLPPVQTLVATLIFAPRQKCKSIPVTIPTPTGVLFGMEGAGSIPVTGTLSEIDSFHRHKKKTA